MKLVIYNNAILKVDKSEIKQKLAFACGAALVAFIWAYASFAALPIDTRNYQTIYYYSSLHNRYGIEFGFYYLAKLFVSLGANYWLFRAVLLGIGMLLLFFAVHKINGNPILFFSVYFLYPLLIDLIQIRFFLSISIVVFSLVTLLTGEKEKVDYLRCGIGIIIASTIQATAIVFLVYLLAVNLDCRRIGKLVIGLGCLECILMIFYKKLYVKMTGVVYLFRDNVTDYTIGLNVDSWAKYILMEGILTYLCIKAIDIAYGTDATDRLERNICYTNFLFVNLTMLNDNFNRFFRTSILFLCLFICKSIVIKNKKSIPYLILFVIMLLLLSNKFVMDEVFPIWNRYAFSIRGLDQLLSFY